MFSSNDRGGCSAAKTRGTLVKMSLCLIGLLGRSDDLTNWDSQERANRIQL